MCKANVTWQSHWMTQTLYHPLVCFISLNKNFFMLCSIKSDLEFIGGTFT
jgi:hypothetical protein